jgi:hypothetical protein
MIWNVQLNKGQRKYHSMLVYAYYDCLTEQRRVFRWPEQGTCRSAAVDDSLIVVEVEE